jgi:hypothetical protein
MSSSSLTPEQLSKVNVVATANRTMPAATWAALALYGDQYAQAALKGISDPQAFFGQVIENSNLASGVSESAMLQIEQNVAQGYLDILNDPFRATNPDGSIRLPNTTEIETN